MKNLIYFVLATAIVCDRITQGYDANGTLVFAVPSRLSHMFPTAFRTIEVDSEQPELEKSCKSFGEILAYIRHFSPRNAATIWTAASGDCLETSLMNSTTSGSIFNQLWSIMYIGSIMALKDELNFLQYGLIFDNICLKYSTEIESMVELSFKTNWPARFSLIEYDYRADDLSLMITPYWNLDSVCRNFVFSKMKIFRIISLARIFRADFIVEKRETYRETILIDRKRILESSSEIIDDFVAFLWQTGQIGGLYVKFENEIGIDQGGVFVDWVTAIGQALVKEEIFIPTEEFGTAMTINTREFPEKYLKLIGIVLGLSLLHDTHIGIPISIGLFKFLLNEKVEFDNLKDEFPQLHRQLANFDPESVESDFGDTVVGGSSIPVTRNNILFFQKSMAEWKLIKSIENKLEIIREGFELILGVNFRDKFSPSITATFLKFLVCGETRSVTSADFLEQAIYDFRLVPLKDWNKMEDRFEEFILKLSHAGKLEEFLAFITGNRIIDSRPIHIVWIPYVDADARFPTVSTCTRTINIPLYSSEKIFEAQMMLALNDAGSREFGLY